jgi:tRNA-(ms[2]io[6]A)-hydroxylase
MPIFGSNSRTLPLIEISMAATDYSDSTKNILGLHLPSDPRWVNLAAISLEEILTDHAYCEQKAALTCISLIQKHPEKTELVYQLAPIVSEEWGHFILVIHELQKRK